MRNMALQNVFVFIALIAGCMAIPTPATQDLSMFFDHTSDSPSRIVGGTVAAEGSARHMVALSSGVLLRSFSCGGSVISRRTVLTAAHCIDPQILLGQLIRSLRATVGTNRWNLGGASYGFDNFGYLTHEDWTPSVIKNDIGLLFTSTNIVFSATVAPVAVSFAYVPSGLQVRATGWGRIRAGGPLSTQLLELVKYTISGEQCVRDAAQAAIDLSNMQNAPGVDPALELCTFHSEGHGMCNGDSGSALVSVESGQQVGIVSWGFPCALGAPDMFVRVSTYSEWLVTNVRN